MLERGVTVEGELGRLAGVEDDIMYLKRTPVSKPEEVEEFVAALAWIPCNCNWYQSWSIEFKGEPKPLDILEEIQRRLPGFPIVLHGASSVIPEYVT